MKISFIGTFHLFEFTPKEELIKVLELEDPEVLFVEVDEDILKEKRSDPNKPEISAAIEWGRKRGVPIYAFDADLDCVQEGADLDKLSELSPKVIKIYRENNVNWIKANKDWSLVGQVDDLVFEVYDKEKYTKRQNLMRDKINRLLENIQEKSILCICGAGHLPYFHEQFPDANFPLK